MLATTFDRPELDRWFLGTWLRVLATRADTGGSLGVMEQRAARGFSPPRHVHHGEDTAILVLSGQLTVEVGETRRVCGPGGFVWLPRDVPHTFRVDSDEVHMLELITPAGMEQFHVDASEPAARPEIPPPGPPDVDALVRAIEPYRCDIIGPPMAPDD